MQSKSTRGVQQDEVWAAADALIAVGERPTIERVRLKIGRGSPNTVSPMLESWFTTLAPRLGIVASGSQAAEEGAPKELRQALDSIWAEAVIAARDRSDKALDPERDKLAQERQNLKVAREELGQREAVLTERGIALEQALDLSKSQLREKADQLAKISRDFEQARDSIASLVQVRDADRRQFDKQLGALAGERQRMEERASANEKRLLEEVDRARQEAKQMARVLHNTEQKHVAEMQVHARTNAALSNLVQEIQIETATFKERLKGADERAKGLENALANASMELRRNTKNRPVKPYASGRRSTGVTSAKRER